MYNSIQEYLVYRTKQDNVLKFVFIVNGSINCSFTTKAFYYIFWKTLGQSLSFTTKNFLLHILKNIGSKSDRLVVDYVLT